MQVPGSTRIKISHRLHLYVFFLLALSFLPTSTHTSALFHTHLYKSNKSLLLLSVSCFYRTMTKYSNTFIQHTLLFLTTVLKAATNTHYYNHNHFVNRTFSNFSETIEPPSTATSVRQVVIKMQEFESHPKEKEMKVNHETLRRIQWWANLLDGVCDADADGQAVDSKSWHKMNVSNFLTRIGLAFFLGKYFADVIC